MLRRYFYCKIGIVIKCLFLSSLINAQNIKAKQINEHFKNPSQNSILAKIFKSHNFKEQTLSLERVVSLFNEDNFRSNRSITDNNQNADYEFHGYPYRGSCVPFDAITDSSGNVYITGTASNIDNPQGNFIVVKLDSQGNLLWERNLIAQNFQVAVGLKVVLDSEENPIISGITWNDDQVDVLTIKIDRNNGNTLWEATFNNIDTLDVPTAITITPDDQVVIAGISYIEGSIQYMLLKYDDLGSLMWSNISTPLVDNSWNEPTAVSVSLNNTIAVTGFGAVLGTSEGYFEGFITALYDPNGQQLWVDNFLYERPIDELDPESELIPTNSTAYDLVFDNIGNVYVTGTFDTTTLTRMGTIKYSILGERQWVNTHRVIDQNNYLLTFGYDIKITSEDILYIGGKYLGENSNEGLVLVSYNNDGSENWIQTINDIDDVYANCHLILDENERPIITGMGFVDNTYDTYLKTIRFNQFGDIINEVEVIREYSNYEGSISLIKVLPSINDNIVLVMDYFYTLKGEVFETISLPLDSGLNNPNWIHIYERSELNIPQSRMLNALSDNNNNIYSIGDYGVVENYNYYQTYFITKYNENGEVEWDKSFNELNGYLANGITARITNEDELVVVLLPNTYNNSFPMRVLKYDSEGNLLWETEKTVHNATIRTVFLDESNNIFLAGIGTETETSFLQKILTFKISNTGEEVWSSFETSDNPDDFIYGINQGVVDNNGNIYLTGKSGYSTMISEFVDFTVVKYNSEGELQWLNKYPQTGFNKVEGIDIKIGADDAIYTVGVREKEEIGSLIEEMVALKLDEEGFPAWEIDYGQSELNRRIKPYELFFNSDGNLIIPNYSLYWVSGEPTKNRITTLQIDQANGVINWEHNTDILRYYGDAYVDANDDFYIINQAEGNSLPHGLFGGFADSELTVIDNDGDAEIFYYDTPFLNLYQPSALCPLQNGKLLIAGHLFDYFGHFSGLYFYENIHEPLHINEVENVKQNYHSLFQNHPNPAQDETTISFYLKESAFVTINLYNNNGQIIKCLTASDFSRGYNSFKVDISSLSKGIYFYEMFTGQFKQTRKMIKQ